MAGPDGGATWAEHSRPNPYAEPRPASPAAAGRTGTAVRAEGWLCKKTSHKPHRWQRRFFVLVASQEEGLVTSRVLQYYDGPPPRPEASEGALAEPKHAIPLSADRRLEIYKGSQFKMWLGVASAQVRGERELAFKCESAAEAEHWVDALTPGREELGDLLLDAAQENNRLMLRHALDAGAAVDFRRGEGLSPLQWASLSGFEGCVAELLLAGAVVSGARSASADGWTPLHAAAYGGQSAVLGPLMGARADPYATDADGRTAFELAEEQGHTELMDTLVERYSVVPRTTQEIIRAQARRDIERQQLDERMRAAEAAAAFTLPEPELLQEPEPEPPQPVSRTAGHGPEAVGGDDEDDLDLTPVRGPRAGNGPSAGPRMHSAREWNSPAQSPAQSPSSGRTLASMADALGQSSPSPVRAVFVADGTTTNALATG